VTCRITRATAIWCATRTARSSGSWSGSRPKLNAAVIEALNDRTLRQRFADMGQEIFPREQQAPEALAALQKAEIEKWWPVIRAANIKGS
jgi:tripartite-type tricarboxylate transporter receptor subunit TctC